MAEQDVAILMYHEVLPDDSITAVQGLIQSGYVLPQSEFRNQLEMLSERGFKTPTMTDVVGWINGQNALPRKSVLITFDDGFAGNFQYALPLLDTMGFGAVFFVATNKIGDPAMMTWPQLAEAVRRGVEVESHTASHPLLSELSADQTRAEFLDSRDAIEQHTGRRPRFLSLPNGDSNQWYREIAREAGYLAVCGSRFGRNARSEDPYALRRIAVKRGISSQQLGELLEGRSIAYQCRRAIETVKSTIVGVVGKSRYDRLYNALYRVAAQQRGPAP